MRAHAASTSHKAKEDELSLSGLRVLGRMNLTYMPFEV